MCCHAGVSDPFKPLTNILTLEFKHKIRLFVRLESMLAYFSQSRVARGDDFQPELRIFEAPYFNVSSIR